MKRKTILIVGTADTKSDELLFMKHCIEAQGGNPKVMDVGVLGDPGFAVDYSKHDVAKTINTTNKAIIALGDENKAMTKTAEGASKLVSQLYSEGKIDGMIALGGTMGTDLALDVASSLPFGVPKYVVSTISFSHLIPPERISPDLSMMLWSGGLYGINKICKSVLRQACGAVVGAARASQKLKIDKPLVAMSSLGKSALKYMVYLKPELEKRGFELVVFHTTGQGGRALEWLASKKRFAAVLDFSLQEVVNDVFNSIVTSGKDRLENTGLNGIPQIIAPGSINIVDIPTWQKPPKKLKDRPSHVHNRLISSVVLDKKELRKLAVKIAQKIAKAKGKTKLLLPLKGVLEWDRKGRELYDPETLHVFFNEMKSLHTPNIEIEEINCHINDQVFADRVLDVFDDWIEKGIILKQPVNA
ncbi:Tm-1-like ATP-binding domain-containing protein [Aquimarina sp. TRL1]|uniref:Tm-1-like ATP-binding domain-containing protein n=1 Tax=Aquimarina sp. (strain TRL1) TaxID=2736252 RepID=UPI00158AFE47|nr:Tm-1-like ATP-binding domain-containing protein [Aquimarina sp. TRL1]QKX05451.1 Tm-1-like ATP-binding domain-containing protein [Aquimarina sp. TRL1]